MFNNLKVVIVIPAYKTKDLIEGVISGLPCWVDNIVVVDDCSPDNLYERVSAIKNEKITLVRNKKNLGVGGAMKVGIKEALKLMPDIVVKMDSDGQMDPGNLPALIYPIAVGAADFCKGNRFHDKKSLKKMPIIRKLGNITLTFLNKAASGYWHIFDHQNGYLAVRAKYLELIDVDKLSNDYFFENSFLCSLNIVNARASDIFMPARYDGEVSSLSIIKTIKDFPFRLLTSLLNRIFFRYVYNDVNPVAVMGFFGGCLLLFGLTWGGIAWIRTLMSGLGTPLGTIILGALPIIVGFELCLSSLSLDITQSPKGPVCSYLFTKKEIQNIEKKYT